MNGAWVYISIPISAGDSDKYQHLLQFFHITDKIFHRTSCYIFSGGFLKTSIYSTFMCLSLIFKLTPPFHRKKSKHMGLWIKKKKMKCEKYLVPPSMPPLTLVSAPDHRPSPPPPPSLMHPVKSDP